MAGVHHAEKTMLSYITDPEALETLLLDSFPLAAMPTEDLRLVLEWALAYFAESGMTTAPTEEAIRLSHGATLVTYEVATGDPTEDDSFDLPQAMDSIEWATATLIGGFAQRSVQGFVKQFVIDMNGAPTEGKAKVVSQYATELVMLDLEMSSTDFTSDLRTGFQVQVREYEKRVADPGHVKGMRFGMAEVDEHTHGIQTGELAVLAAASKVGKSFWAAHTAIEEWRRGRVATLFTLENSVPMTIDRIACIGTHVDYRKWQQGKCNSGEILQVRQLADDLEKSDVPLWILQPEPDRRTMESMVREAIVRGTDSLLIDQLTFVHPKDERLKRDLQIREMMHDLKSMISGFFPCLLFHQINRDGQKAADKLGHLEIFHMAEGSEVERTADWIFSLYQSKDMRVAKRALLQILGARREDTLNWEIDWRIADGLFRVRRPVDLREAA